MQNLHVTETYETLELPIQSGFKHVPAACKVPKVIFESADKEEPELYFSSGWYLLSFLTKSWDCVMLVASLSFPESWSGKGEEYCVFDNGPCVDGVWDETNVLEVLRLGFDDMLI